ncbi:hypothetical protein V6N11_072625 [Hibiscus sabdariffa]|uniref:Reverse transcriptase/retrotransposon-derived protein RNase H-like domain-containing protein n=1 Tax=Hibiscus sabdariffa TaxID=183260 RepID=A0ABR2U4E3_9ROSI
MLSERKMKIAQKEIEFLGMNLKGGQYQPGPHIAQELLKFPKEDLAKKQVLQFLGIVNYLRDFIPKISKYTNPLRKLLKKDPPPWSKAQTMAVKVLKEKLQQLPPLQIPSDGKRILQTDATSIGELFSLKKKMEKDTFVDTRVEDSQTQRFIITPLSRKS